LGISNKKLLAEIQEWNAEMGGFIGVTSVASFAEMSPVTCSVNYHYPISVFLFTKAVHVLNFSEIILGSGEIIQPS
jgi:hypothetical protein